MVKKKGCITLIPYTCDDFIRELRKQIDKRFYDEKSKGSSHRKIWHPDRNGYSDYTTVGCHKGKELGVDTIRNVLTYFHIPKCPPGK